MNTAKEGKVRCILFQDKEDGEWYGVAMEFNIVVSGDDPDVVNYNLQEAIQGYVESIQKIGGTRAAPLNQKADTEYESLWKNLSEDKPVPSPFSVRSYGYTNIEV